MNSLIEKGHNEIKRLFQLLHDALRDHFDREQRLFRDKAKDDPGYAYRYQRDHYLYHKSTHQS